MQYRSIFLFCLFSCRFLPDWGICFKKLFIRVNHFVLYCNAIDIKWPYTFLTTTYGNDLFFLFCSPAGVYRIEFFFVRQLPSLIWVKNYFFNAPIRKLTCQCFSRIVPFSIASCPIARVYRLCRHFHQHSRNYPRHTGTCLLTVFL